MTDGGWKVALYLDDRASAEQSEALGAVFSGGAGGYLAGLGPLIGEVAAAAITFEKSDGSLHAEVAGIRLCLDCVDVCAATAGVIGRQTDCDANVARPLLEACVAICKSCGDECERHAHMPHCRICAEACRRCERACQQLLDATK